MSIFSEFSSVIHYSFAYQALICGLLISLCSSLLGVVLVQKRFSMIGDGLSHVGFGALSLALAFNASPLAVSVPVVIFSAFILLKISTKSKIKADAAIALISTGAASIGILAASLSGGINTDVYSFMFGSILALSPSDLYISVILSLVVIVLFIIFYNRIFITTFDEAFARANGISVSRYNMLIALLSALTIVIGMRVMGTMLISSLIIFPALTSMQIFKSFKAVVISSGVLSVICCFLGITLSFMFSLPTGASIVCVNIVAFFVFWLSAKVIRS